MNFKTINCRTRLSSVSSKTPPSFSDKVGKDVELVL